MSIRKYTLSIVKAVYHLFSNKQNDEFQEALDEHLKWAQDEAQKAREQYERLVEDARISSEIFDKKIEAIRLRRRRNRIPKHKVPLEMIVGTDMPFEYYSGKKK